MLIIKRRCRLKTAKLKYICLLIIISNIYALQASGACTGKEWDCDNGDCIPRSQLCDGLPDCTDGSDEIAKNCIHMKPSQVFFRCAYGALTLSDNKCNGKKDCADNSDEISCNENELQVNQRLQKNCGMRNIKCGSGECIPTTKKCDGRPDCRDGSDETVEYCAKVKCPNFSFQCGYGGCISNSAKCNGVDECADGADEAWKLCGYPRKRSDRPLDVSTTPTVTRPPIRTPPPQTGCHLNQDASNLIITDLRNNTLEQGFVVSLNAFVKFSCEKGFTLLGKQYLNCQANGWNDELPTCHKYCRKKEILGISTRADCYYRNLKVECDDRILPGTVATISCATYFEPPYGYIGDSYYKTLTCQTNGNWNFDRPKCTPKCGTIQPDSTEFIRQGTAINITKVPWHVGIYSSFNRETYQHSCGGTIISPSVVVSAAHCFWDKANSKLYDKSYYSVAAGKYYRDYDQIRKDSKPQIRNITNIIVHHNYQDVNQLYLYDMAILVLERPFDFTASIRPICIIFRSGLNIVVPSNNPGLIAGWGISDDNNPSEILQSVDMKTISHYDCRSKLSGNYQLPDDKFCIGNDYGGTACRGDSGGGFFTRQIIDDRKTSFYGLEGIISHAPENTQDCAKNVVALTSIQVKELKSLIEYTKYNDERNF